MVWKKIVFNDDEKTDEVRRRLRRAYICYYIRSRIIIAVAAGN